MLYRRIATKLAVDGNPQSQQSIEATTKALIATGRAMEIRVNPRYGTWSTRNGIQPLVSGGLAASADQLRDQG